MTSLGIQSSILEQVVKLNDDNWHTWKFQIMMAFQSNESDEIAACMEKEPFANKADKLRDWKRKNKLAMIYMWSHIEPEWQHLVLGGDQRQCCFHKTQEAIQGFKFQQPCRSLKGILQCCP